MAVLRQNQGVRKSATPQETGCRERRPEPHEQRRGAALTQAHLEIRPLFSTRIGTVRTGISRERLKQDVTVLLIRGIDELWIPRLVCQKPVEKPRRHTLAED